MSKRRYQIEIYVAELDACVDEGDPYDDKDEAEEEAEELRTLYPSPDKVKVRPVYD